MISIDSLIDARWVIPVEPRGTVLERQSVAIQHGRILEILPTSEASSRYTPQYHYRLADAVLIPGLINLHTHAAMALMRGLADDLSLMAWLNNHIWPTEQKVVNHKFVFDGSLLACAEMLRAGVTCFNDMYFFPQATAQAVLKARMRATVGVIVMEFPSTYAGDPEDYLHRGLATRDEYAGEPLLRFSLAPHAPYTVSDKSFTRVLTLAEQLNTPIHIHLHETQDEIQQSLSQYQLRPLARLAKLGLLGPNLLAVHAVHCSAAEIALLAQHGCHAVHCPTSNLKLASGFAPVTAFLNGGINVGIGTDGAASNNRLDMLAETRLAALLAKGVSGRAQALPAWQALEMATLNGARALGLDSEIGSLLPGKAADITAIRLGRIETTPCFDPVSHLVYAASREHVSHVWVNGELVLADGHLIHLDTDEISAEATYWQQKISEDERARS